MFILVLFICWGNLLVWGMSFIFMISEVQVYLIGWSVFLMLVLKSICRICMKLLLKKLVLKRLFLLGNYLVVILQFIIWFGIWSGWSN